MSSDATATSESDEATDSGVELHPLGGEPVSLAQQTRLFQLMAVVIDPYTDESSWILRTASRILGEFAEADCRTAWIVTCGEDDSKRFLGPYADEFLTFCDEDRSVVDALGLDTLPALVTVDNDGEVMGSAEGWDPPAWREVTDEIAGILAWSRPVYPKPGDPAPFPGTPAKG
ncbi:MAG: TlpA family protein disulfide reductase [Microthrixaceae bacterium]